MKPSAIVALGVAICVCACAKGGNTEPALSSIGRTLWPRKEDNFVSMLKKKQDANLVSLAQQRAAAQAEEEAIKAQTSRSKAQTSRSRRVPPRMYRTTEPPLPEPDLSLPIQDVPR